jgi:hypothetical protein
LALLLKAKAKRKNEYNNERIPLKLSPCPFFQFFNDNGDPLSGGLLYTYEAGATPAEAAEKATCKDSIGTANTNPIVLDAAGRCDVWLGDGVFKFVLACAGDTPIPTNPIKTIDNIQVTTEYNSVLSISNLRALGEGQSSIVYLRGNVTNGDGGQGWFHWDATNDDPDDGGITFQPSTAPAQGRWVRDMDGFVDPRWYGATGDGSTDDRNAFFKANTAAAALSFPVRCTAGTYRMATTIAMTAPVMLMPRAVLKWSTIDRPTFPVIIEDNDYTQHFDSAIPYDRAPIFYVAGANQTVREVRPEWFGGKADSIVDNYLPIYKAMQSIDTFGGVVKFSAGEYRFGTTIPLMSNITLRGTGPNSATILRFTNAGAYNGFNVGASIVNAAIESMAIGRVTANELGTAIYSENNMVNCRFTNLSISEFAGGIFIMDAVKLLLSDITLAGCGRTVYTSAAGIVLGSDVEGAYKSVYQASIKNVFIYLYSTGIRIERAFGSAIDGAYVAQMNTGLMTKTPITATGMTVIWDPAVVGSMAFYTANTYDLIPGNLVLINPYIPWDASLISYGPFEQISTIVTGSTITVIDENGTNVFPIAPSVSMTGIVTRTWDEGATTGKRVYAGDVGSAGTGYSVLKIADEDRDTTYNFASPTWVKFTKSHTEYTAAATEQTVKVFDLPAKCMIHSIFVKHTEAWIGPSITKTSAIIHPTSNAQSVSLLQTPIKHLTSAGGDVGENTWTYSSIEIQGAPSNGYAGFNLTNLAMRKHYSKQISADVIEDASFLPYSAEPFANDSDRANSLADYINKGLFHITDVTGIYLLLSTAGANLSALTSGEIEVSFLISKLP